ncbi:unnamed protein product [Adineta ricciae]|uniref:Uncharacterized protein n=1 Tax=Adineta ricciae TaxID=249248 RepID=A0A815VED4_ADIRI|nr:unnamed protein product [Adineta ricciae]CAF1534115.1 unnamed protein product [Adineta ricciae]
MAVAEQLDPPLARKRSTDPSSGTVSGSTIVSENVIRVKESTGTVSEADGRIRNVLFYMDLNNKPKKITYFTVIDSCLKDMSSVVCVFEHVLDKIKRDVPNLTALYTRSDNAGCYSGTAVIMARQMICLGADFGLKRTDFSEPQRGKDRAGRDICDDF